MAMDKTTTRRMIGAIVLVLVAALVLAYLLKSKGNQPEVEKIQDVTLPSSPILAFPGDGTSDAGTAETTVATTDNVDNSKDDKAVGLDIIPRGAAQQPADAVSQAARNAGNNDASSTNDAADKAAKADAEKEKKKDLTKADVVTLGNQDRVKAREKSDDSKSSKSDKSDKKSDREKREEKKDKPRLVNEKKLPKYSDSDKKKEAKELPKRTDADSTVVATDTGTGNADIPTSGFSIQLLATGLESKAEAVKNQMVEEGYPAYITTADKEGTTLYRVRVGAYQDRSEVDDVQARMKRRYLKNINVQNSLVVTN